MDAKFYVPYETARELRLKGYPQSSDTWYVEMARGVRIFKNQTNKEYEYIARPTYHEVLDWLTGRGKCICIDYHITKPITWYGRVHKGRDGVFTDDYPTREYALNAAILEALK